MAQVIALANHKGGVGKTTCTVNLAYNLSRRKSSNVLVIDCDPQGNASMTLGELNPFDQQYTTADLFGKNNRTATFSEVATKSIYDRVDIIPSNLDVSATLAQLDPNSVRRFFGLQKAFDKAAQDKYNYILLDCPPTIEGTLLINALVITNHVIIPVDAESNYALSGVSHLVEVIKRIREDADSNISVLGLLFTMFDSRTVAGKAIRESAISTFGEAHVFKNAIPRATKINQAAISSQAVCDLDPNCASCKAYRALAKEIEEKIAAKIAR
jgi:chromosome partitioning protein